LPFVLRTIYFTEIRCAQKIDFILYVFFWVIPRRLNFICRRFGTLYLFHLHRQEGKRKRRRIKFRRRRITQKKA
jgi:hypothetical protein